MKKITVSIFLLQICLIVFSQSEPVSLYIRGTGLNRNNGRVLKIGDQVIYNTASGRGLRLTIINKSDQSVVFDTTYDTYGNSTASESLAIKLNSITKLQIGVLTSYDAWESKVTANLDQALFRLGLSIAGATINSGSRRPYAAIFEGVSNEEKAAKAVEISTNNTSNQPYADIAGFFYQGTFVAAGSQNNALYRPQGNEVGVVVDYSGNVGIGNTSPDSKLDVSGTIKAQEIEVTLANMQDLNLNGTLAANNITYTANGQTADHVFDAGYNLRSLEEIEAFILENKHLPDVPSAAAMEEQGVNLAEMNKLLLQKVEELTLYIITQDKKLSEKDEEINLIKKEFEERLVRIENLMKIK